MTEFKVGDRVAIATDARYSTGGNSYLLPGTFRGTSGIIERGPDRDGDFAVKSDTGGYEAVSPQYLTRETYTFDPGGEKIGRIDVRREDTVAVLLDNGTWRIGKVDSRTRLMEGGVDIRLLHRPEPEVDQAQVDVLADLLVVEVPERATPHDLRRAAERLVKAGVKVDA